MPSPEAIAHFDERFECHAPRTTRVSAAFIDRICSATRAENRAAAAQ
ncbi:13E12 repeat family protein, partial [Mycobacterium tuberculosis UT0089]